MLIKILIPMRAGSQRLPFKHFVELEGTPIYEIIFNNVKSLFPIEAICFCIPDTPENDSYEQRLHDLGTQVFRGDEHDVLSRLQNAARKSEAEYVARLCGDNIFLVEDLIEEVLAFAESRQFKVITNAKHRSFPKGCTFEAIETKTFLNVNPQDVSSSDREHVFPYFYRTVPEGLTKNIEFGTNINHMDLTVDDPRQMSMLRKVFRSVNKKTVVRKADVPSVCDALERAEHSARFDGKTGKFSLLNVGRVCSGEELEAVFNTTHEVRKLGLDALEFSVNQKMKIEKISDFVSECKQLFGKQISIGIQTSDLDTTPFLSEISDFVSVRPNGANRSKLASLESKATPPFVLTLDPSNLADLSQEPMTNNTQFVYFDCNEDVDPLAFVALAHRSRSFLGDFGVNIRSMHDFMVWSRLGRPGQRVRVECEQKIHDREKLELATKTMVAILNSNIHEFVQKKYAD